MWALAAWVAVVIMVLVNWRRSGQALGDFLGLGVMRLYARLWHRCSIKGPVQLPHAGPAILVANHTCAADPAFLTAACPRPLSFLLAQEYYEIPFFRPLFDRLRCVPVNRNRQDTTAVRACLRRLSEGRILCIFPEGGLSNAGRNCLRPGKAGVAYLALRSRAPVIPALITDGPQVSDVLPAWLKPSRVSVTFGLPVDLSAYYGRRIDRKLLEEVTAVLMNRVAALGLIRFN